MIKYILFILIGFISGSMMYSYLLPKWFAKTNIIDESKDNNPGAVNAIKHAGTQIGIICLLLDMLKGFIPVFLACVFTDRQGILFSLVIASPVLGHAFSPMLGWKGGKAIASSFGVLLGLIPNSYIVFLLAALYIFFSIIIIIRPHEMRTVLVFILFAAGSLFLLDDKSITFGCFIISGVVILKNFQPSPSRDKKTELSVIGKKIF